MKPAELALMLGTVALISTGQILFKIAANSHKNVPPTGISSYFTAPLILALVIYTMATFMWILVLRNVPLKVAYPFMGLSFVVVPLLASVFLGESMRWNVIGGAVLIAAGITLATIK